MLNKASKTKAFTIIELMIIVAIIGILAVITIPSFLKFLKRSKTTEALENLRRLYDSSIGMYEADHTDSTGEVTTPLFPETAITETASSQEDEESNEDESTDTPARVNIEDITKKIDRIPNISHEKRKGKRVIRRPTRRGSTSSSSPTYP